VEEDVRWRRDSMSSTVDSFLHSSGQPFVIHRGSEQVGEAVGLKDGKRRTIVFRPDVDIRVRDWLEDKQAQARLRVTDIDHLRDFSGSASHIEVLYETEIEYERLEAAAQVIAMLDDIADAIWTLSDEKMPPEKKKRARDAVKELKEIVRSLPPGAAAGLAGEITSRLITGG
jgi:hypothetical protein